MRQGEGAPRPIIHVSAKDGVTTLQAELGGPAIAGATWRLTVTTRHQGGISRITQAGATRDPGRLGSAATGGDGEAILEIFHGDALIASRLTHFQQPR